MLARLTLLLATLLCLASLSRTDSLADTPAPGAPVAAIPRAGVFGSWYWSDPDGRMLETLDFYPSGRCIGVTYFVATSHCMWYSYRFRLGRDSLLVDPGASAVSQPYALDPDSLHLTLKGLRRTFERTDRPADTTGCFKRN